MSDTDYGTIMDVLKHQAEKQKALSVLLAELHDKHAHHLAIQSHMGDVDSYVTSVPFTWIVNKVRFAADLPLFKESSEGSKRIDIDPETIQTVTQRQPDWSRQREMAVYLATARHHKFPALLLVAYQHWVYEIESDKWGPDEKAMQDSLTVTGLEPSGTYWDLHDSDTHFYALDGQHRLMAIQGLKELVTNGSLHAMDKDRKPTKQSPLSRDQVIDRLRVSIGGDATAIHERMQRLMDERIGIEILPAVRSGETFVDALHRLRQLFVDVNQNAKRLTKPELAQLDEKNGFRIVARKLMGKHALLGDSKKDGVSFNRVDVTKPTLRDSSPSYTTLDTLATIVERYLVERATPKNVSSWRPLVKGLYQRPDDESLKTGTSAMIEYFDAFARVPSHTAFIQGKSAGDIRKQDDSILFRPIVQKALAEAVGKLFHKSVSLDTISNVLAKQETKGQLRLTDPSTPWFGVLCEPVDGKMRRHKKHEELCCHLFQYLLGGGIQEDVEREELREKFAAARRVDDQHAIDLKGKRVKVDNVVLPNPWH